MIHKIQISILSLLAFFSAHNLSGQGLCEQANWPDGSIDGGFEIVGGISVVCESTKIEVKDHSNGTGIKYNYDYQGEALADLTGETFTTSLLPADEKPKVYTILQYGKLNGKDMFACKQVTVLPKIDYSYTLCAGSSYLMGIYFANAPMNDYHIEYKIANSDPNRVTSLPYEKERIEVQPEDVLEVYAVDKNGKEFCSAQEHLKLQTQNPYQAAITQLEVLDPGDKVELTFQGALGGLPFNVYRYEAGTDPTPVMNKTPLDKLRPGKHMINLPDNKKSYCFFISRPESCGGTESPPDICTIPVNLDIKGKDHIVDWKNHPEKFFNTDYLPQFNNSRKVETYLEMEENNFPVSSKKMGKAQTTYTNSNTDCKLKYCYQIIAEIDDFYSASKYLAKSISRKVCYNPEEIHPSPITDVYVSVSGNTVDLNFTDNSGWSLNKEQYFIYHNGEETSVRSVGLINIDSDVFPDSQSECFQVGYEDECGSISEPSEEVCTIFLSEDEETLQWTEDSPFTVLPDGYDLEELSPHQQTVESFGNDTFIYQSDFSSDSNVKIVRIAAKDKNGNISYSNEIEIIPNFAFYLPNLFTPNGDGKNETFKLLGKKSLISDFQMEIYDRWGEKLIEFDDKEFEWDGTVNGAIIQPGVYHLKIRIVQVDQTVNLIRERLLILK